MSHESHRTMNDEPRIDELLESFRPGVDNLATETWDKLRAPLSSDPDLQRRAELVQQRDRVIGNAMQEVPIPAGLAERLLANLPASGTEEILSAAPTAESATVALPPRAAESSRMGRRLWVTAFVGALAIAVLVFAFWPNGPTDYGTVSEDELARMIDGWENDPALAIAGVWKDLAAGQALPSHPFQTSDISASAARAIGPVDRDGLLLVVYDLAGKRGTSARLYVAHTGSTFAVPKIPQTRLAGLTGTRAAVAWQRGEYLYVIVVDSREARPTEFVRVRDQA